jgi:hypothetical protein
MLQGVRAARLSARSVSQTQMTVSRTTRCLISGTVGALIVVHGIFPNFALDLVTVILLALGVLPWLTRGVESVELPGGVKITLRDVERAENEIASAVAPKQVEAGEPGKAVVIEAPTAVARAEALPPTIIAAQVDPNLSLVSLRIEIEKRLRTLANSIAEDQRLPLARLLRRLQQHGVLDVNIVAGLDELIRLGNSAAHGATVEPDVASWASTQGDEILKTLDEIIRKRAG